MTTDPYFLSHGAHRTAAEGRCAMEFVAYLASELHSDRPACVSRLLRNFCVVFNDALPDDARQRLRPYLARTIGTAGDGRDKERAWLCADWLIRVYVPAWLELAELPVLAARLRGLPEVVSPETLRRAAPVLAEVRLQVAAARTTAGRVAAGAAAAIARRAAGNAWTAAWVTAGDAAWFAAEAAREAVRSTAGDAAAGGPALRPTVVGLQRSMFDLLDRMLPTEPLVLPAVETANPARMPVGAR